MIDPHHAFLSWAASLHLKDGFPLGKLSSEVAVSIWGSVYTDIHIHIKVEMVFTPVISSRNIRQRSAFNHFPPSKQNVTSVAPHLLLWKTSFLEVTGHATDSNHPLQSRARGPSEWVCLQFGKPTTCRYLYILVDVLLWNDGDFHE